MMIGDFGKHSSYGLLAWLGMLAVHAGCGSSQEDSLETLVRQVRSGASDRIVVPEFLVQDEDLALLADLPRLVHLSIQESQITDKGLRHLAGLKIVFGRQTDISEDPVVKI